MEIGSSLDFGLVGLKEWRLLVWTKHALKSRWWRDQECGLWLNCCSAGFVWRLFVLTVYLCIAFKSAHLCTPLCVHSLQVSSYVLVCLYITFNSVPFCVLVSQHVTFKSAPLCVGHYIIPSGWLGSKHQLTNWLTLVCSSVSVYCF